MLLALLFLSAIALWPVLAVRADSDRSSTARRTARLPLLAGAAASFFDLSLFLAIGISVFSTDFMLFYRGVPPLLSSLLALGWLTPVAAATLLAGLLRVLRRAATPLRVQYAAATLAATAYVSYLAYWRLLSIEPLAALLFGRS
jgi:hypothetical protein